MSVRVTAASAQRTPGPELGAWTSTYEASELSRKAQPNPFPSWVNAPISAQEIQCIMFHLRDVFQFQEDNARNMFSYLMKLLDLRALRLSPMLALKTLHADYIGGAHANLCKWYFAAQMYGDRADPSSFREKDTQYEHARDMWLQQHRGEGVLGYVTQISLWLLIWGEANNVRFMPECLCFLYKCCHDYLCAQDQGGERVLAPFLDHAITPIYKAYRLQCYTEAEGRLRHRGKDHAHVKGYDDFNQLFWYQKGLWRLKLDDKTLLMAVEKTQRYLHLPRVRWDKAVSKTYRELRTWLHVVVNFSRVWVLHLSMFWYYTAFNSGPLYTPGYRVSRDTQPPAYLRLTVMSVAGPLAVLLLMCALVLEAWFVPRLWVGARPVAGRLLLLLLLFCMLAAPTVLLVVWPLQDVWNTVIASFQFALSILSVCYLLFTPLSRLFMFGSRGRRFLALDYFTSDFHQLLGPSRVCLWVLWLMVFFFKFVESYFFLTLSLRDPLRELSVMEIGRCSGDAWTGPWLCRHQPHILLVLILALDFILFFLDTYLWYITLNTLTSVFLSIRMGITVWTPWKNIFSKLPGRLMHKVLYVRGDEASNRDEIVHLWNSFVFSLFREHYISLEQCQRLAYLRNGAEVNEPKFFVSQEDDQNSSLEGAVEAQRRVSFFAQSLATPMPGVRLVAAMPCFTVLVPHFKEAIILSYNKVMQNFKTLNGIAMFDYLKQLHPAEWANYLEDTKRIDEEDRLPGELETDEKVLAFRKETGYIDRLQERRHRAQIWNSLRLQTLFRTVAGFMKYSEAIQNLAYSESLKEPVTEELEKRIRHVALTKFRIIVSMQRYTLLSDEDAQEVAHMLRTYPEMQIAYIDEEQDADGNLTFYSVLVDGTGEVYNSNKPVPKYRIRLSGNPILGDGKSDNQNHAVIFTRGEYIQLIDANQDNYEEECFKIRSTLAEFEEMDLEDPYEGEPPTKHPVAIIGTREYIFSENAGILGDVAAGKEQTFGTLFARTLAHIGGKLHYGHPDFLNAVFMTTRGGVSKAQKGLHLNEDIYAGMNAISRGGRIKHCEYMQCGKGRDLGFESISNFITKIGAGMGEQILSREYFYLGTQLPIDRFLLFYYAHAGFHLNNVAIMISINLFLMVGVNLAALTSDSTVCEYNKNRPFTDPRRPISCLNLVPVVQWLERCIHLILIVLVIAFVPLGIQELTERGFYKAITRLGKHFGSLSPLFEVFVCKIYAQLLVSDLAIGGAQYISTGRGLATQRNSYATLYSRFGNETIMYAAFLMLLVMYISISMWKLVFVYFWFTILALLISPFIYNPHQYVFERFFRDYLCFLGWLFEGSRISGNAWIDLVRVRRSRFTGVKTRKRLPERVEEKRKTSRLRLIPLSALERALEMRPSRANIFLTCIAPSLVSIFVVGCAYLFANAQNEVRGAVPTAAILRILFVSLLPIVANFVVLLAFFAVSLVIGPFASAIFGRFGLVLAGVAHVFALLSHIALFELLWLLQDYNLAQTVLGFALCTMIQRFFLFFLGTFMVSREYRDDAVNWAWWLGQWFSARLLFWVFVQPFRELCCKTAEMLYFAADLVIGHLVFFIQLPIVFVPLANLWHSVMLFWAKPGKQVRFPRRKEADRGRGMAALGFFVMVVSMAFAAAIFVVPLVLRHHAGVDLLNYLPEFIADLQQPTAQSYGRKGLYRGLVKNV